MGIITIGGQSLSLGGQVLNLNTVVQHCVGFCSISTTAPMEDEVCECVCGCLYSSPAMISGEYYCPAISWMLYKPATCTALSTYVCITCNGTCIRGCCIGSISTYTCAGAFTPFCVTSTDCIHIINKAQIALTDCEFASSSVSLNCVSGCSNYCVNDLDSTQIACTSGGSI
jgi:hypothetical protein